MNQQYEGSGAILVTRDKATRIAVPLYVPDKANASREILGFVIKGIEVEKTYLGVNQKAFELVHGACQLASLGSRSLDKKDLDNLLD